MVSKSGASWTSMSAARYTYVAYMCALLLVWFSSSIISTLVNKLLMKAFPYPVTISAVHMCSSVVVDYIIISSRGMSVAPFRSDVFFNALPVAATINFGKTLTYVSYGLVPPSLTHTAKASSPLFSVILTKLMFNRWPNTPTAVSLLPLSIGVILSAISELDLVIVGFLAAVAAALANVLNSIYTKRALNHISTPDPLIFHMYTSATATVMLAPYVIFKDAVDMSRSSTIQPHDGATSSVAMQLLLISLALHYLQNISSIYFLSHVTVLTHQVAQSLKRLFIIASSVVYFNTPTTPLNIFGMAIALAGFFAYSLAKSSSSSAPSASSAHSSDNDSVSISDALIGFSPQMSAQQYNHRRNNQMSPLMHNGRAHDDVHEHELTSISAQHSPHSDAASANERLTNGIRSALNADETDGSKDAQHYDETDTVRHPLPHVLSSSAMTVGSSQHVRFMTTSPSQDDLGMV